MAAHSPTLPTPSISAVARSVIRPEVVADVPSPRRGRQVHWRPVEHGYANGLDHESSRCVEAKPIFEIRGEVLSVLPQSVVEHPFELHREDKIPGLAAIIRERGIWPRHSLFSVFLAPAGAKDRSHEFGAASRDTLLGGIIARIKFDDGSHLSIVEDSDLVEFIHHHAWFEGDEVALSREDRVCLLGNLTGRTSKRRRATQFWSSILQCGKLLSCGDTAT